MVEIVLQFPTKDIKVSLPLLKNIPFVIFSVFYDRVNLK